MLSYKTKRQQEELIKEKQNSINGTMKKRKQKLSKKKE
jgi:hypothetical protein